MAMLVALTDWEREPRKTRPPQLERMTAAPAFGRLGGILPSALDRDRYRDHVVNWPALAWLHRKERAIGGAAATDQFKSCD